MNARSATIVPSQKSRLGVVVAKDGDWGWVIVFAAFMVYVLSLGILFSLGILSVPLADDFKESKASIALACSIAVGTADFIGPVVSGLTNKYGCRAITIAGSLLTCFGMLSSILAPSVYYLYFTFGPTIGIGIGMMFLPSVIIVNSYFEEKRALATGISMCGMSVGTLVLSPMIEIIQQYYGHWNSTVLILAGLSLNGAVFGSLYRPPDIWVLPAEESEEGGQGIVIFEPIPEVEETFLPRYSYDWKYSFPENKIRRTESEPAPVKYFVRKPIKRSLSVSDIDDLDFQDRGSVVTNQSFLRPRQTNLGRSNIDFATSKTTTRRNRSIISYYYNLTPSQRTRASRVSRAKNVASGLLYRKDIFYSASLLTIPEYRDNDPEYYESLVTSVVEIGEEREAKKWYVLPREVWDGLNEMLGFSLLKDRAYQVISISRFIASLGILVPYLYVADFASDVGIANGSLLISIISVGNMLGRLGVGFLSDHRLVNRMILYKSIVITCGFMIGTFTVCYTFVTMAIVSVVFGSTVGAFSSILPIILVDVMGIAKLTSAFGLATCFQGIASMVGLPITAILYDKTGSYVVGFVFSGILVLVSSVMTCFLPFIIKARRKRMA